MVTFVFGCLLRKEMGALNRVFPIKEIMIAQSLTYSEVMLSRRIVILDGKNFRELGRKEKKHVYRMSIYLNVIFCMLLSRNKTDIEDECV